MAAEGEDVLRAAALLAGVGSMHLDPATGTWTYGEELWALWGVPPGSPLREDPDVFGRLVLDPDDQPAVVAAFDAGMRDGGAHEVEFAITRVDTGERRHVRSTIEVRLGADGAPEAVHGMQVDVTELVVARQEAAAAGALHRAVLAATPDVVFVTDVDASAPVYVSPSIRNVLGYDAEQHLRTGAAGAGLHVHEQDLPVLRAASALACRLPDGEVAEARYRVQHADGHWVWVHRRATPFRRDASGRVTQLLGVLRDVSEQVRAQERLAHLALHDALTGLPNRASLLESLEAALAGGGVPALVYLDLDGFKRVNDAAGHAAGDALLREVAARLEACGREGDVVARLAGDEFVLLLAPRTPAVAAREAREAAERAVRSLGRPVVLDGTAWTVTASAGVALGEPGSTAEVLLQDADAALYQAKAHGKDRVQVFEAGLREQARRRLAVEQRLRAVLAAPGTPGFGVVLQPVRDARGHVVGAEALARLDDEHGRPVSPELFVPVAEESGLVRRLGARVLDLALAALAAWREDGHQGLTVAVNVSAVEAQEQGFCAGVLLALIRHGLDPADLVLELTETALLQADPNALSALHALHRRGVRIAIDDFGTGYASLRYLTELPVDVVKVDRSFTAGLPDDPVCATIVRAVSSLAADLGLECVVEGVETEEQLAALPPWVQVQGWLLGRPASAAALDLSPRRPRVLVPSQR